MKPKPVVTETICSECGLDWERHGDTPTQSDCIRLLKADLATKPMPIINYPTYPIYPNGPSYWYRYGTTTAHLGALNGTAAPTANVVRMTPAINTTACVSMAQG